MIIADDDDGMLAVKLVRCLDMFLLLAEGFKLIKSHRVWAREF